jgi:hypothetical protein
MKISYEERLKNSNLFDYIKSKNDKQINLDDLKQKKPKILGYINGEPLNKELYGSLCLQGEDTPK